MRRRLVVGLTGGIASGKTTAVQEFKRCGASVLSLDEVAHRVLSDRNGVRRAVARIFGPAVLNPDRTIHRAKLGRVVFADSRKRRRLEAISHPVILREMRRWLERVKRGVAVVDVPLLFEKGLQRKNLFDLTLLVDTDPALQIHRIIRRNGLSRAQARVWLKSQWPIRRKRALADLVLPNVTIKRRLRTQVREFFRAFQLMAA